MAAFSATGNSVQNDVIQAFGQTAQPVQNEHPAQRDQVMEFRRGNFSINVNMVSYWDQGKGEYGDFAASISVNNNRRYSSLPTDPKVLNELGDFLHKVAKAIEGAPTRDGDVTKDNIDEAKRVIAKYKK